jgi:NAD-dependent SIR2 family protein deacetylase
MRPAPDIPIGEQIQKLAAFAVRHQPLFVLTGAGCSTASGIPDYRDREGRWKHSQPVLFQDFMKKPAVRRRYWARSMAGWPAFSRARPNGVHWALASLEEAGFIHQLVTQNVDGLHRQAGSRQVTDLHGRLDSVICMDCGQRSRRSDFQQRLHTLNSHISQAVSRPAPDGDAHLEPEAADNFVIPSCPVCEGILKPAVVFFGEAVPKDRVKRSMEKLKESGGMLVVGSSLMVFSGYRYCRTAAERKIPIAAVNLGKTRADPLIQLKLHADCTEVLQALSDSLSGSPARG